MLEGPPRVARIGVLGVAFKANTDDVRESAALTIIPALQRAGCTVVAHDPKADLKVLPKGTLVGSTPYEAAAGADVLVILTEWDEYRRLDFKRLHHAMRRQAIFDGRNLFDPEAAAAHGFAYRGIGRGTSLARPRPDAQRRAGYAGNARVAAISPA
jgi:UDPglucose 6-dehydrogenase